MSTTLIQLNATPEEYTEAFKLLAEAFPNQYVSLDLELEKHPKQTTLQVSWKAYVSGIGSSGYSSTPMAAVKVVLTKVPKV